MRKMILASISNALMVIIPLLGNPSLMVNYKILIIIVGSICMWLTQPAFTLKETSDKKSSDRFSVLLILFMSFISVIAPILDWAYIKTNQNGFSLFTVLGILMIIIGITFRALAVKYLGKYFTPTVQIKEDHYLFTSGPYSVVRHPSYTGAFFAIIAGGVLLESLLGFIISCIAMMIAYFVRIRIEEKELIARFGNEYKQYQLRTKMIIPYVW